MSARTPPSERDSVPELRAPHCCVCYGESRISAPPGSRREEEEHGHTAMAEQREKQRENGGVESSPPCPGDTLPWNLDKNQRAKRSRSASGDVLDPAERAVVRIAGAEKVRGWWSPGGCGHGPGDIPQIPDMVHISHPKPPPEQLSVYCFVSRLRIVEQEVGSEPGLRLKQLLGSVTSDPEQPLLLC
ncbi:plectin-like isoform X1 [Arapaima gigas]